MKKYLIKEGEDYKKIIPKKYHHLPVKEVDREIEKVNDCCFLQSFFTFECPECYQKYIDEKYMYFSNGELFEQYVAVRF
jgi:hypothetical protein